MLLAAIYFIIWVLTPFLIQWFESGAQSNFLYVATIRIVIPLVAGFCAYLLDQRKNNERFARWAGMVQAQGEGVIKVLFCALPLLLYLGIGAIVSNSRPVFSLQGSPVEKVREVFVGFIIMNCFIEEFAFRGVLLRLFLGQTTSRVSLFLVSALFAIAHYRFLHFDTHVMLGIFQFSLSFFLSVALVRIRISYSLWAAILAHALVNLGGFLTFVINDVGNYGVWFLSYLGFASITVFLFITTSQERSIQKSTNS